MGNKNQPAFSFIDENKPHSKHIIYNGLSKMEYAAIMAMQGILASEVSQWKSYNDIAERSVIAADELFNQLEISNHGYSNSGIN